MNGPWQFEFGNPTQPPPFGRQLAGEILVPFAPESRLSGVEEHQPHLWYRRHFEVPTGWRRDRVLLHFGAVDWEAEIWVNGRPLAMHRGGYDPFTVDVTAAILPVPEQELIVRVFDPTGSGEQMRGEQSLAHGSGPRPAVSGIWQTVWMEPVPRRGIDELLIEPDLDSGSVAVTVGGIDPLGGDQVEVEVLERGGLLAARRGDVGERLLVPIPAPRAWSPEDPFLYDLRVIRTGAEGKVIERVHSYFGLRTVGRVTGADGLPRITINGEPRFLMGVLDRGLWPGGLYTPPDDEAVRMDLATAKSMGFDLVRKHAKVEPERWYAWCDRLGLLVWQDLPWPALRTPEGQSQFEIELDAVVAARRQHPSIIGWVMADQEQGQPDASRICAELQAADPGRLVTRSSSWIGTALGTVADAGLSLGSAESDPRRLSVLGQYGGTNLPIEGHTPPDPLGYQLEGSWVVDAGELAFAYEDQARQVWGLVGEGLAAAFYAQLTDVESRASGLMTYDREVIKVPVERLARANQGRFAPLYVVLPAADAGGRNWRYRTTEPEGDWLKVYGRALDLPGSEESWVDGVGGFGEEQPGTLLRTPWTTPDIWMISDLNLPAPPEGELVLRLLHGGQVTVWINGKEVLVRPGSTGSYVRIPTGLEVRDVLIQGQNRIAVHCRGSEGQHRVDLGVEVLGRD